MLHSEEINYKDGSTTCRGFITYDPSHIQPKACVLIAHDWTGRSEEVCSTARQLANLGYVAFSIDMYGNAKRGKNKEEKRALLNSIISTRQHVTNRILAAYHTACSLPYIDSAKIAAIGYCFGGLCVLDLARSGADIKGVISFHGLLNPPEVPSCTKISAKILILHGYDDPLVLPNQVSQFAQEMTAKKVDWQIHMYGLTQHSFTDPLANDDEMGLHYNEKAAQRAWLSATSFLSEIFKHAF